MQTQELSDLAALQIPSEELGRSNTEQNLPAASSEAVGGILSPIPEESEPPTEDGETLFMHEDPVLREVLSQALQYEDLLEPIKELPSSAYDYSEHLYSHDTRDSPHAVPLVECYHIMAANVRAGLAPTFHLAEEPEYVEVYYEGDTWKLLAGIATPPAAGEVVVLRVATKEGTRRAVVQRDDDTLTAEEKVKHRREVEAAMLAELKTWAKFGCISRKSRRDAKNIIDCRWVLKWKWDFDAVSVSDSHKAKAQTRRVIRARLTVRGFKDLDKGFIDTYAGTSQRYSQRIICSEAVCNGWRLATTDISKAFLQGVTYEELSKLTGEPIREVNFYLPTANVPLLQSVAGFEDFDPNTEVLHCDKPGTGSVDAPRCFSMKLSICTTKCGLFPSSVDPELCMIHKTEANGEKKLVCLMTKHVDDLKVTGEREWIIWVLEKIQETFGNLKILWDEFTNCGVHHHYNLVDKSIELDQIEYAKTLRAIAHSELTANASEADCGPDLLKLYQSLLGAVAYLYLTRVDILVFISACQRHAHAPKIIHVKRLNSITRWVQRNPKKLRYRPLGGTGTHLRVVSDAAFKKEEDKGHSLRGSVYLRAAGTTSKEFHCNGIVHLLEYLCKALRHVTRSTFSAELHAGCDSADLGILICLMMHEIAFGTVSKAQARAMRDEGGYGIPMTLQIDAMSVYAAITATYVKHPAEKGLLSHVQFIRELLDCGVITALMWIDTRDMLSDGLTKGAVDRRQLHDVMEGIHHFLHECKIWQSNLTTTTQRLIERSS